MSQAHLPCLLDVGGCSRFRHGSRFSQIARKPITRDSTGAMRRSRGRPRPSAAWRGTGPRHAAEPRWLGRQDGRPRSKPPNAAGSRVGKSAEADPPCEPRSAVGSPPVCLLGPSPYVVPLRRSALNSASAPGGSLAEGWLSTIGGPTPTAAKRGGIAFGIAIHWRSLHAKCDLGNRSTEQSSGLDSRARLLGDGPHAESTEAFRSLQLHGGSGFLIGGYRPPPTSELLEQAARKARSEDSQLTAAMCQCLHAHSEQSLQLEEFVPPDVSAMTANLRPHRFGRHQKSAREAVCGPFSVRPRRGLQGQVPEFVGHREALALPGAALADHDPRDHLTVACACCDACAIQSARQFEDDDLHSVLLQRLGDIADRPQAESPVAPKRDGRELHLGATFPDRKGDAPWRRPGRAGKSQLLLHSAVGVHPLEGGGLDSCSSSLTDSDLRPKVKRQEFHSRAVSKVGLGSAESLRQRSQDGRTGSDFAPLVPADGLGRHDAVHGRGQATKGKTGGPAGHAQAPSTPGSRLRRGARPLG